MLEDLIALAVRNHPAIAAARFELGAARAETSSALSLYLPIPSVQSLQEKGRHTTILAVNQPLYAGGRIDAGLAAARSREDAARAAVEEASYELALRLTGTWAAWLQAQGRVLALTDGIALLSIYGDSVSRRILGGASAEVDRELVNSRLAQLSSDLATNTSNARAALVKLSQIVGQPLLPDSLIKPLSDNKGKLPITDELDSLDKLNEKAVEHSPSLKRIAAEAEAARYAVIQKSASLWPSLNLRGQYQHGNAPLMDALANERRIMLVLEYSPGAGASAIANIDAAQARMDVLRERLVAARRDLIEKVSTDYEDYLSSSDRIRSIQRTIQANAEVLSSYERLFIAGKRSWLDVINAARELIQARIIMVEATTSQIASRHRLCLHLGESF